MQAASARDYEEIGANVNAEGGEYGTALRAASSNGHKKIVKLLWANGVNANANRRDGTALRAASLNGREETVRLLLENGANINAQDKDHTNRRLT